jgi:hypothetical protein
MKSIPVAEKNAHPCDADDKSEHILWYNRVMIERSFESCLLCDGEGDRSKFGVTIKDRHCAWVDTRTSPGCLLVRAVAFLPRRTLHTGPRYG